MADVQLSSGLWVPERALSVKSDRIAQAEFPRGPVADWAAVSRFRDFASYLKAIKIPWVWAAYSVIAYNFASNKWGLASEDREEEDVNTDPNHPLIQLFQKPNPNQSGFVFKELSSLYTELTGNCYITMEEVDASGQPRELYLPNPSRMRIKPGPHGVEGYIYDASPHGNTGTVGNGQLIPYDRDEVIHISYPALLDGYYGVGNIEASEILLNIVTAMSQQEFSYWDSGGRIIGVLETDNRLSDADFHRLKRDWQLASSDRKQRVRTAILEQGLKYTPIAEGMRSLDLVNIDKSKRDQILAVAGVPLPKVGIMEMANYKMEEADAFFHQETMDPKYTRWEDAIQPLVDRFQPTEAWLFTRKVFEDDQYKLDSASKGLLSSLMTIDESRAILGLPPLPNHAGEVILISSSYSPVHIGDVGKLADATIAPPEPAISPTDATSSNATSSDGTSENGNLVHLTDHLAPAAKAEILANREHWKIVAVDRQRAASRAQHRKGHRTPMQRAAEVYAK
jgi:HK97 family phage portal protein